MWRKSRSKPQAGFTIPEVLVTLIILVAILVVAAQVLFETRNAAERQRAQVEARQFARSAVEYLHYMLRGSTDLNNRNLNVPNPLSLLFWVSYQSGGGPDPCDTSGGGGGGGTPPSPIQVSYDNVSDPKLADLGTDIINFAKADNVLQLSWVNWPGFQAAATGCIGFDLGCPSDPENMELFKQATGAHYNEKGKLVSEPFLVVGDDGNAAFMQIVDYQASYCIPEGPGGFCKDKPGIKVITNPGLSDKINPPGGLPCVKNPLANIGVRYIGLRVKNGWLQQKNGYFDPNNPDAGFYNILPNVEDLQIAYLFRDGSIRNATLPRDCGWATNCVPVQNSVVGAALPPNHAANVIGLRVTITTRSTSELPITQEPSARFFRPAAENHEGSTVRDRFYRYQTSTMILLRNRSPQA